METAYEHGPRMPHTIVTASYGMPESERTYRVFRVGKLRRVKRRPKGETCVPPVRKLTGSEKACAKFIVKCISEERNPRLIKREYSPKDKFTFVEYTRGFIDRRRKTTFFDDRIASKLRRRKAFVRPALG